MNREKSNNWKYTVPILILTVIMMIIYIPRQIQQNKAQSFAHPIFVHPIPEGAEAVQGGAGKDGDAITAAVLLKTDLSPEEVIDFYDDVEYLPYEEGETVELLTKPVDEATIEAMQKAEIYEDGANYLFVYIKSE